MNQSWSLAFVMKNQMPYSCKVLLLHEKLGKIWCIFNIQHQAALLHTGSLIRCRLEPSKNHYRFIDLEIESMLDAKHILLVHDFFKICMVLLPSEIAAPELFDFLSYVFSKINDFNEQSYRIVLLRLFLMFDCFVVNSDAYRIAISDPMKAGIYDLQQLNVLVSACWDQFYEKSKPY